MSCVKSQLGFFRPLTIGDEVNFRLTYDGPLKAASQSDTRRELKHRMRVAFSQQLGHLYVSKRGDFLQVETERQTEGNSPVIKLGPFLFLALVRERLNLVCDLDILFLRRESPGQLISSGGDLDNRIKVLFDSLRIPQDENEIRGFQPSDQTRKLILCLTEDDKLITGFRVTTDRLLDAPTSTQAENDVRLIINVEVKATRLTEENMAYFSHF